MGVFRGVGLRVLLQVFSRAVTFVLNVFVVRAISKQAWGLRTQHLELLLVRSVTAGACWCQRRLTGPI